jgi:hypothetical protein
VAISRSVRGQIQYGRDLSFEADSSGEQQLTGIYFDVEATDPEGALANALDRLRVTLDQLRLRFYVRTHVCGAARIVDTKDGAESWFALPQPFWTKKPDRRAMPQVPPRFDRVVATLDSDDQKRWHAARWHLSQAFADWPEDSHSAAAHCWLGIECFAPRPGTALPRVKRLADGYLATALERFCERVSQRVTAQSRALSDADRNPDWYYRLEHRVPLMKWVNRVLDERSCNHYSLWRSPEAPAAIFDPEVGMLQLCRRRMTIPGGERWMDDRIQGDLALLYGLRNTAVHTGERIFSRDTATYLGRLACEIILAYMNDVATRASQSTRIAPRSQIEDESDAR